MRKTSFPLLLPLVAITSLASAQTNDLPLEGPFAGPPAAPQVSAPFLTLPLAPPYVGPSRPVNPRRKPPLVQPIAGWDDAASAADPLVHSSVNENRTPTPGLNFQGQSANCGGCTPPDTIGAVGNDHYLQMVNATRMAIYDKTTGTLVSGPSEFRLLWPSGNCRNSTRGDPVVVYDTLADRWVLAQFSTVNAVCVAVSQTDNPTGAYNLYEFATPEFPDYFKIGVWPNAYYMGSNENAYAAYALDRANMLAGTPATTIRFTGQTNFLLPATVVGDTAPAAGAPGVFYTFKDNSFHGGNDRLEFFHFAPNFTTPASSTFTLASTLNVAAYTYTVCGFFNLNCAPQGGTTQRVDVVSEWPMWQLQYRNMGGSDERFVANFAVDVGSDRSGIRWYQINRSGGTYSIAQEGTFAPADTLHRFMGSIGIDQGGNIALGYNASSGTESPSLRYATRAASDPAGTLQAEVTLQAGGGSQTGSNRWGDYSALTIDPEDNCTFWFTGEYYASSSGSGWTTRIGNFVMPECAPCQITACPGPATVPNAPNQCGASFTYAAPTTTGNCGAVTCTPASGSFFPVGTTNVSCTTAIGSQSCSFAVTVEDTQAPSIICPPKPVVPNDPGLCSAVVTYPPPTVGDNCPGVGSPTCVPPSGSVFPVGATPVTCTVDDAAGNSSSCGFDVGVMDTEPPVVTCGVTKPKLWPPNHELVNVGLSATASDNCAGALPIAVAVFGDEDDLMPGGDGRHSPDAKDIALGTLRLRSERVGSADGRVYLGLESTTDGSGNTGHACCTVVVPHDPSPASMASVNAQAAAAVSYCTANGAPPPSYFVVGDGPVVGPKQ
jgi:hypothetical protein